MILTGHWSYIPLSDIDTKVNVGFLSETWLPKCKRLRREALAAEGVAVPGTVLGGGSNLPKAPLKLIQASKVGPTLSSDKWGSHRASNFEELLVTVENVPLVRWVPVAPSLGEVGNAH